MDDNEKIAKACEILKRYNVAKNLTFIFQNSYVSTEDLAWDKSVDISSIPKGDKIFCFTFEGKYFQLLTVNKRLTHDGEEQWSDFSLNANGAEVLKTVMRHTLSDWGTDVTVEISPILLKSARLGPWMEDIQRVRDKLEAQIMAIRKEREQKVLKQKADDIDLGNY